MLSVVYIASSPGPVVSKITLGHQLGLGKIVGVVGIHFFFLRIPMTGKAERNTLAESIERVMDKDRRTMLLYTNQRLDQSK